MGKTLLALTFITTAWVGHATDFRNYSLEIEKLIEQKYVVTMEDLHSETEFKIVDAHGNVLKKLTYKGEFKKVLNFKFLPLGGYSLIFDNEYTKVSQPFEVKNGAINFEEKVIINYPTIDSNHRFMSVTMMQLPREEVTQLRIFDDRDNEVFTYEIDEEKKYVFDMSSLPQGDYAVSMSFEGKTISQSLTL